MIRAIFATMLLLALVPAARAQSGPADITIYETPSEARWAPFAADMPACDDNGVLSKIASRFWQTESIYWNGQHAIQGFQHVREIGFRSNGLSYIPRRYCVARIAMAEPPATPTPEKPWRTVVYSVAANTGILGWSPKVDWCVVGLDREHAYAPDCLVLRPILERWIGEYKPFAAVYGLKARY